MKELEQKQNDVQSNDVQDETTSLSIADKLETSANASDTTASGNWDFYNQMQATQPKTSNGGKNFTNPTTKNYQKKRRIKKTQRNSRRINRKK